MTSERPILETLASEFSICRLNPSAAIPSWALHGSVYSITRTDSELSIVCESSQVEGAQPVESGWRAIAVQGPLDFSMTGLLASISAPLADNGISIFVISTYDTDIILVKSNHVKEAQSLLMADGYRFAD
ncbi:MAG: ACT domain-containing protein [Opitutales bacterium]